MDNLLGLLRIRVKRGINLAVRDVRSSDPYVVIKMGKQKLKTRVIRKDVNPEWNEDLTLSVSDPGRPISLTVFDHDTFSKDDKMGEAQFDIEPFIEAVRMKLEGLPDGTVITKIQPSRNNCLSEESTVVWKDARVVQDMCLRLKNVECGEVEIQLQWIELPGSKGIPWNRCVNGQCAPTASDEICDPEICRYYTTHKLMLQSLTVTFQNNAFQPNLIASSMAVHAAQDSTTSGLMDFIGTHSRQDNYHGAAFIVLNSAEWRLEKGVTACFIGVLAKMTAEYGVRKSSVQITSERTPPLPSKNLVNLHLHGWKTLARFKEAKM
ncbi:UNVERIFIED_CONTAM: protein C2-DOMAIN ABA-RELATED 4 [Sesamum latifolium]|uniref:Protein C2-DOMAIN ABA-RELATED 4 n=2 Tax=Sesamum TaxID=4181 RepID=A0AAW2UFK2_9LAMI